MVTIMLPNSSKYRVEVPKDNRKPFNCMALFMSYVYFELRFPTLTLIIFVYKQIMGIALTKSCWGTEKAFYSLPQTRSAFVLWGWFSWPLNHMDKFALLLSLLSTID